MTRKNKTEVAGIWINPNSTLSRGHITWDRRKTDALNARYLDLADLALNGKAAKPQGPGAAFAPADETTPQWTQAKAKLRKAARAVVRARTKIVRARTKSES